jgi:hypothetical protein
MPGARGSFRIETAAERREFLNRRKSPRVPEDARDVVLALPLPCTIVCHSSKFVAVAEYAVPSPPDGAPEREVAVAVYCRKRCVRFNGGDEFELGGRRHTLQDVVCVAGRLEIATTAIDGEGREVCPPPMSLCTMFRVRRLRPEETLEAQCGVALA